MRPVTLLQPEGRVFSFIPLDPGDVQIQVVDFGHATCSVHHHIRLERPLLARGLAENE
jgi:hypothetical protein